MSKTSSRKGWDRQPGFHDIDTGKGKTYRKLVKFTRPCAQCQAEFAIHVTEAVADGNAHNSSFGLKNCEKHRLKMLPPGGGSEELERLRSWKATVSEELKTLDQLRADYNAALAEVQPLKAEIHALKTRLAAYELGPAMEAAKPAEQPKPAFDRHAWLAAEIARKDAKPLPWK